MKYILDFDDTIFDAKKLKKILNECGIAEDTVSGTTFDEIKEIKPDFDIESLLFSDALEFLIKHKDDCEIVTTYLSRDPKNNENKEAREAYQATKIALCGITELLGEEHRHIIGASKKEKLIELRRSFAETGEECIYVDDRGTYVKESEELGIRTFFMNREKFFGPFEFIRNFERTTDVSSFKELEEQLQKERKKELT